jgi:hypothetical protein
MSWAARSATSPFVAKRRLACHRNDKTRHAHSPLDGYARWGSQLIAPRPRSPKLCLREERQLLALRLALAPVPALALAPALTLSSSPSRGVHFPFPGERSRSASVHDRAAGVHAGGAQVGASGPGLVISVACKPPLRNKRTRRGRLRHHHKNYLSEGGGPRTCDSKPDEEPGESELTPAWAPDARPSAYALRPIT